MLAKAFYTHLIRFILLLAVTITAQQTFAQNTKHQIAVFAPIYLDDAFDGSTYKIWENKLPKSILPGLEFYNGVTLAIDSLKKTTTAGNLYVKIYDYKSKGNSLNEILAKDNNALSNAKVIIASFNNRSDIKILADYAKQKNIPLISATYPNDGGISDNPYFFLLNSSLHTHSKALYGYFKKFKSLKTNLLYVTRSGAFEDMVNGYFKSFDSAKTLNITPTILTDTFYSNQLIKMLDSTKQNVIFCGTVNEAFALKIASVIAAQKKYKTTLIGMPTWDGLKGLDKNEYKGIEFIYTTPYNYSKTNDLVATINKSYYDRFFAKPSDYVFKGYETMLRFGKTVSTYGTNAMQLFGDDMFKSINSLDIQPVYNKDNASQIDFYENKKLYFIKKVDGVVKSVE
ncbi:MAG: ABC transporter substrate-binding protein [Bacteroidetes bacterium]|nr:ABC transporter substrate-binding protein [Bacteroidota bacterium]